MSTDTVSMGKDGELARLKQNTSRLLQQAYEQTIAQKRRYVFGFGISDVCLFLKVRE